MNSDFWGFILKLLGFVICLAVCLHVGYLKRKD